MGMAVDWIGQNLYWTDEGLRGIFVADLKEASKRLLLISKDLVHPRSIVVDSENGVMYWANWPAGPPLGTFFHLFFFLRNYFKFGFQFFLRIFRFIFVYIENELKESTGNFTKFYFKNSIGKIEVSWLDGSNRRPLVQDDIIWPNGLSIDKHNNR